LYKKLYLPPLDVDCKWYFFSGVTVQYFLMWLGFVVLAGVLLRNGMSNAYSIMLYLFSPFSRKSRLSVRRAGFSAFSAL